MLYSTGLYKGGFEMRKSFVYASGIGLVIGMLYWFFRHKQQEEAFTNLADLVKEEEINRQEAAFEWIDTTEKVNQTINQSLDTIHERHSIASSIMTEAYSNIMDDFVKDGSVANVDDDTQGTIIDDESSELINKSKKISDELDGLLG